MILPEIEYSEMFHLLEKIRVIIRNCNIDNIGCKTVSIGATQYQIGDNIDSITKRADDALYEAKNNGRNRMVIY